MRSACRAESGIGQSMLRTEENILSDLKGVHIGGPETAADRD